MLAAAIQKVRSVNTNRRNLPNTASFATADTTGKLSAPSAVRNGPAIAEALAGLVPDQGTALEIASGTGEHVVRLAQAFPGLIWQPTDIDPARLASIALWRAEAALPNILPPEPLDATVPGWARDRAQQEVILLSNLTHLISMPDVEILIAEAAAALVPGGVFLIYGPFLRGTEYASDADRAFDASLRQSDMDIGYKSFQSIQAAQQSAGLAVQPPIEMPANNLLLAARR